MPRVAIAICTRFRNELLRSTLQSIATRAIVGPGWELAEVIVVDNDPDAGARGVADEARCSGLDVRYVLEPVPGRAAARNRVLDEGAAFDALALLDDDEEVGEQWPVALLSTLDQSAADLVGGPVVPVYAAAPSPLADELFRPRRLPGGSGVPWLATGNLVLRPGSLAAAGLRFDAAYDRCGGEDFALTKRARAAGLHLVWCETGSVREHVGLERLKRSYLLRRRVSQVSTTIAIDRELAGQSSTRVVTHQLGLFGKALVAVSLSWVPSLSRRWNLPRGRRSIALLDAAAAVLGAVGRPFTRPNPTTDCLARLPTAGDAMLSSTFSSTAVSHDGRDACDHRSR